MQASYSKTMGKSGEESRVPLFYRGKRVRRGSYKQKVHWGKLGVQNSVSLSCDSLLLAGPLPGKEKTFPSGAEVVVWICKVPFSGFC